MIQYHAVNILKLTVKELKGEISKESNKRIRLIFCLENREMVLEIIYLAYIRKKVLLIDNISLIFHYTYNSSSKKKSTKAGTIQQLSFAKVTNLIS